MAARPGGAKPKVEDVCEELYGCGERELATGHLRKAGEDGKTSWHGGLSRVLYVSRAEREGGRERERERERERDGIVYCCIDVVDG